MKSRPTANPQNRFHEVGVEYEPGEGPPPAQVRLIEDHSRSILATNDSPDVGFNHSVNPYRGCLHACAYCLSGDTLITLADGGTRRLADLRPGDAIYGTQVVRGTRRYVHTGVLHHWATRKAAFRVVLADGGELVASGDHRFLGERGWGFVSPAAAPFQRPVLSERDVLLGPGTSGARRPRSYVAELAITSELHYGRGGPTRQGDPAYGSGARLISQHRGYHLTSRSLPPTRQLEGREVDAMPSSRIVRIEPIGVRDLFDITTGTGDFIANGVISHNCYARPSHEYLDMGAGTDFDTKIVVKPRAAELLREAFDKPSWRGELVMFSGVTDCYQAVEKQLELTKQCLEVCLEYRNPVAIITKSALIERDLELLVELHKEAGVHVSMSIAWVDPVLARQIEPWAPAPERRFKTMEKLAAAGVPVGVMCAPVMPGLNDGQMVRVLERAKEAGAASAGWVLLRLPGAVAGVFEERVRAALPLAADKIMNRIRDTRGGEKLYDPRFHTRGRGEGAYASTIAAMFDTTVKRLGLNARDDRYAAELPPSRFARPAKPVAQLSLF